MNGESKSMEEMKRYYQIAFSLLDFYSARIDHVFRTASIFVVFCGLLLVVFQHPALFALFYLSQFIAYLSFKEAGEILGSGPERIKTEARRIADV
jgi:hypothetical protein